MYKRSASGRGYHVAGIYAGSSNVRWWPAADLIYMQWFT